MKSTHITRTIVIVSIVAVVGMAANAFAGWGMGWGPHHRMGGYQGEDYGRGGDWSEEEVRKMDTARKNFYQETESLRNKMYQKEIALEAEFAKEEIDTGKASKLQKDISNLRAELDQKRIEHMAEMRKVNPDSGRGYGRGYGRGMGFSGGGGCWR